MEICGRIPKRLGDLRLFWAVFFAGIFARLVSFAILPESAYTDALHHLLLSRDVIAQQTISLPNWILPPPLMHALVSSASILAGLPVEFPFVRFIPVVLTIAFLLSCYLLFRKMFEKNFIIPLSFAAIFPWLVRYQTVNYAEDFALVLLVFSLYLVLRLRETKSAAWLACLAFVVPAFALTKLNAAILFPLVFLLVIVSASRKKIPFKWIAFFIVLSILLSGFWFYSTRERFGYWTELDATRPEGEMQFSSGGPITPYSLFLSHLSLYDFPPLEWFERTMVTGSSGILPLWQSAFFLVMFPITIAILLGAFCSLRSKHSGKFHAMLALMALCLIVLSAINTVDGVFYVRYFIPVIPVFAVFFSRGFIDLKNAKFKAVLMCAFALFALYSLVMTSASAYQYSKNFEGTRGMLDFVSGLPQEAKIFSQESGRAIGFYSGKDFGFDTGVYSLPPGNAIAKIKFLGFTHIAISCYRPGFPKQLLVSLESEGFIKRIYNDSCSIVYVVE